MYKNDDLHHISEISTAVKLLSPMFSNLSLFCHPFIFALMPRTVFEVTVRLALAFACRPDDWTVYRRWKNFDICCSRFATIPDRQTDIQFATAYSPRYTLHHAVITRCSVFLPARRYASVDNGDRNVSVRLSVCASRAGIVSKRRKLAA